jgi:hypothetical protein
MFYKLLHSILGHWSGVVARLECADIHLDWPVSWRSEWSGDFAGEVARSGIAGKCHAMRLPTIETCRSSQRISWCTVANMSSHLHWVCTCAYGDLDVCGTYWLIVLPVQGWVSHHGVAGAGRTTLRHCGS